MKKLRPRRNIRIRIITSALCCLLVLAPMTVLAAITTPTPDSQPGQASTADSGDGLGENESGGSSVLSAAKPAESTIYRPEVVLISYSIVEGSLVAGESVTLKFSIMNTSRTNGVSNLVLTYKTGIDTIYSVYGEANTSMVNEIAPGATYTVEKKFILAKSAPEITPLEISMRYQGIDTGVSASVSVIYLPIFAVNSVTPKIDVPSTVYARSAVVIGGYCTNMGNHGLKDLIIRIKGDIDEGLSEAVLGDLNPGGQVALQQTVSFSEVGNSRQLYISFYFSDTEGNSFALPPQTYTVNVLEPPVSSPGSDDLVTENLSGIWTELNRRLGLRLQPEHYLIASALVLVSAIAAIFVYIRRRRRRVSAGFRQ